MTDRTTTRCKIWSCDAIGQVQLVAAKSGCPKLMVKWRQRTFGPAVEWQLLLVCARLYQSGGAWRAAGGGDYVWFEGEAGYI